MDTLNRTQDVLIERRGAALVARINRPEDLNRINQSAMTALAGAIATSNADPEIRAVVFTGDAEAFCSGGRIDGHPAGAVSLQLEFGQAFADLQRATALSHKPVIAAVEGQCIAGGTSILAACDMAIASDDVVFSYPEINFGLFPVLAMGIAMPLLPRKIALEMFLTGRDFDTGEALRLGLINKAVPRATLWNEVDRLVEELAGKSPVATKHGRLAYYAMTGMGAEARMDHAKSALIAMLADVGDEGAVPTTRK